MKRRCKLTRRMALNGVCAILLVTVVVALMRGSSTTQFSASSSGELDFNQLRMARNGSGWNSEFELTSPPWIYWWSKRFYPHQSPVETLNCGRGKCSITNMREMFNLKKGSPASSAVLFYGTETEPDDMPFPRPQQQIWGLVHEESPLNNYMLDQTVMMNLFNMTATYHRDADFPLTLISMASVPYILDRTPIETRIKNELQISKGLAPVVYVQSHCEVPSDRDSYVEELMKYIPVDSYGQCVHNKDLPEELTNPVEKMHDKLFLELMSQYKFTLAFENGFCNDYMTEKLYRPLHLGSVPVYRGSPLARDYTPHNSLIMTNDFNSPKQLAEFLIKLNKDDSAYEEYLEFKRSKKLNNKILEEAIKKRGWEFTNDEDNYGPFAEGFECQVCDHLIQYNEQLLKSTRDPSQAPPPPKITDGRKFACPAPQPHNITHKPEWWITYQLEEQYWIGLDNARAIRDMILAGEVNPKTRSKYAKKYKRIVLD